MRAIGLAGTAAICVCMLALNASTSHAEPIAGGGTRLTLSLQLAKAVKRETILLTYPGRSVPRWPRQADFPVRRSSELDFVSREGTILLRGGLRVVGGTRSVTFSHLRLDTAEGSLTGTVAGRRLRLAQAREVKHGRSGFGAEVWVNDMAFTPAAAGLLDRALRIDFFKAGMLLGSSRTNVEPRWDPVVGGTLEFTLDSGTFGKVEALGVKPLPFEASAIGSNPTVFSLPLIGGRIFLPSVSGSFALSEAGLRLEQESSGTQLVWTNLGISLASPSSGSPPILYSPGGTSFPPAGPLALLDLEVARIVDSEQQRLILYDVAAKLQPGAAQLINETFAPGREPVVAAGDPLGTFTVVMQGR